MGAKLLDPITTEDGSANLNGSVSRSYRFIVDEVAGTYNALVDDGNGFYLVGNGATMFDSAEREIYIQIRDRQPNRDGVNEMPTITSLIIGEVPPTPSLIVDRGTGQISMTNTFGVNLDVVEYSIGSNEGGLIPSAAGWDPVSGRLDQTGGGGFDMDSDWTVSSDTANLLAEGADSGNGGSLTAGNTIGLGPAWTRTPIEDVAFSFQLDGGSVTPGTVSYTGDLLLGDLNQNGTLDKADFVILSENSYKDLRGQSAVNAYLLGDLDVDGDNDFDDYQIFRQKFTGMNGAAAFAALTASVPEPAGGFFFLLATLLLFYWKISRQ